MFFSFKMFRLYFCYFFLCLFSYIHYLVVIFFLNCIFNYIFNIFFCLFFILSNSYFCLSNNLSISSSSVNHPSIYSLFFSFLLLFSYFFFSSSSIIFELNSLTSSIDFYNLLLLHISYIIIPLKEIYMLIFEFNNLLEMQYNSDFLFLIFYILLKRAI